jgi:hypothetical protein
MHTRHTYTCEWCARYARSLDAATASWSLLRCVCVAEPPGPSYRRVLAQVASCVDRNGLA